MANHPQFTVGRISEIIKNTLEQTFPIVSIIGEVSNLSKNAKYAFFSIKDDTASLKCVIWQVEKLSIANGDLITATGKITAYKGSSSYQLTVYNIESQGIGAISQQFELLKQRLQKEGLFDATHKKPLPYFVQEIAIISAKGSAALADVLVNLKPTIIKTIHFIPAVMQGSGCTPSVLKALKKAESLPVQAIIIARGGGSFEDLNEFNNEALARAVFACKIPIISAIGHEIDFTILDFVSDIRAPTPTSAAKIVSPTKNDILQQINAIEKSSAQKTTFILSQLQYRVSIAEKLLKNIVHSVFVQTKQRIISYEKHLSKQTFVNILRGKATKLDILNAKLEAFNPQNTINKGFALLSDGLSFYDNPKDLPQQFSIITKNGNFPAKKI